MKKRFRDLLSGNADIHPVEQQSLAEKLFPEVLRNSNLSPWRREVEPMQSLRVVIGIAANYSLPDLEFLDAIDDMLRENVAYRGAIEVFNALDISQMEAFEKYIPGITPVVQTPVVGIWTDGRLVAKAQGAAGRRLVYEVLGIKKISAQG